MKYLLLVLISFNLFASTQIEVFRLSDNKLVAGDKGKNISIESVKVKMLKKGINISDGSKYVIEIKNTTQDDLAKENIKKRNKDKMKEIKKFDCSLISDLDANGQFLKVLCEGMSKK